MGKIYDISAKITNELPALKITDDIIVTINNRTQTVLSVQVMVEENERKKEDKKDDEFTSINKALKLLIGEKKADEIKALDLPMPEYTEVFNTIMNIALGKYEEDTPSK